MPIQKTTKDAIVAAAIMLFKQHGYHNTSMANIGEASGLIKGSIYHHFNSKEQLALACLASIHNYFNKHIFSVANNQALATAQKFEKFNTLIMEYFLNSDGGCLLGNFALEISQDIPDLCEEIKAYFIHWEQAVITILEPLVIHDLLTIYAKQHIAMIQGAVMQLRLSGDKESFKKQINQFNNSLVMQV